MDMPMPVAPAVVLAFLFSIGSACAQSPAPPGALSCLGCHGAPGVEIPSLSGLSADEITEAMGAFKSGARPATLMNRLAKGFSEAETRAIAQWLASQRSSP
jgi:sulfide dehydrogenase cytochrome subunit